MWRWVPRIDVADPTSNLEALVDADLDTLATALYVRTDDLLKGCPQWAPWRPAVGIAPELSDAEALTLAVLQALLGYVSEARWLRFAGARLRHLFPCLPGQPGYNKRLRKLAATMVWLIGALGRDTSRWADDVWVVDSTPVECGRSKETARRSDLAGWAEYGYCASHSRDFWGLRLHLLCTLHGLPTGFALTGAKADERQVLLGIPGDDTLMAGRAGPGRSSSVTRTTTGMTSKPPSPGPGWSCSARPAKARAGGRAPSSSRRCARSSSRSTTPSKASSTSNATVATPQRRDDPGPAAHPGPHRCHLAQRPHRPAGHALTDRL